MGRIIRVKINWTGFQGGPGYTNLHFEPTVESDPWTQTLVDAAVTKVQTFITAFRPSLPLVATTGVDAQVAELDEQSGTIESFWTASPTAPAAGTLAGNYTAGAGFCVNWSTGGVWNGRRVRGRTFVVPVASGVMAPDGTFDTATLGGWRTAATALTSDANAVRLVIWKRPTPGALIPDGGAYDVTGSSINDKVAFLTSRRQ